MFSVISLFVAMCFLIRCRGFTTSPRLRVFPPGQRCFHLLDSISDESSKASVDQENNESLSSSLSPKTHWVEWTTEEGTVNFQVYDGELLRTAALRRRLVSPHNGRSKLINCRGLGTCGTCAVEIKGGPGMLAPSERNGLERLRLSYPPHNPDKQSPLLRLACQVQVHGDLQVTKRSGFWGQYADLSPSSEYQTYFGNLEFLLDNKSPKKDR